MRKRRFDLILAVWKGTFHGLITIKMILSLTFKGIL